MLALIPRALPATSGGARRPLDLPGTLLIGASVVLLLLPAAMGQQEGWPAWTFASLAAGAALALVAAVVLARRPAGTGIVDVGIFRAPGVAAGYGSIFASTAAYGAFLFTLVLLLQSAVGYEAWACGLAIAPYAAGFALTSLNHGRLPPRVRGRAPVAGLGLLALGYLAVGALAEGGRWHVWAASLALALAGAGYGCGFSPVMAATLARVPRANAADASGSLSMTLQFGYVAGVTVLGSLFLSHAHLPDAARGGHAFLVVAVGLAALAALAGWLATRATREPAR
jgi:hypothetical protein